MLKNLFFLMEKAQTMATMIFMRLWARNLKSFRSSLSRCSVKKVFLKTLRNSLKNTFVRVSFLIKLQRHLQIYWKRDSGTGVFEIFKNTFLYRTALVAAPERKLLKSKLLDFKTETTKMTDFGKKLNMNLFSLLRNTNSFLVASFP